MNSSIIESVFRTEDLKIQVLKEMLQIINRIGGAKYF